MQNHIWLIGAGSMSIEYAKVLLAQQCQFLTIGRGQQNADIFREKTRLNVFTGGLKEFLKGGPSIPQKAIVVTGVESLAENAMLLIESGVREILCEKPAGLNTDEISALAKKVEKFNANIYIGYNRRFYSSVIKAREIIQQDGGVTSFNFEFTEWSHIISPLVKAPKIKEHWFLANSTHVVDLAFYLGGKPKQIVCFTGGTLPWHPSASVFSGAGITNHGALFSYQANWEAPGRWAVEILTNNHRLYFKPLEKLQIQKKGSVQLEFVEIDDSLDTQYKPGLYLQTASFLKGDISEFISIGDQLSMMPTYDNIAGYRIK
jgi:predicted dehydrogenase